MAQTEPEWINKGGLQGYWSSPVSGTHKLSVWWDDRADDEISLPFGYGVRYRDDGISDSSFPWDYAPDLATAQRLALELWQAGPVPWNPVVNPDELDDLIPF